MDVAKIESGGNVRVTANDFAVESKHFFWQTAAQLESRSFAALRLQITAKVVDDLLFRDSKLAISRTTATDRLIRERSMIT
jgi:hypothetical protein